MDCLQPSARQLALFEGWRKPGAVGLFYQYDHPAQSLRSALSSLALEHGGRLVWSGVLEQALIGDVGERRFIQLLRFERRGQARAFVADSRHRVALEGARNVLVSVVSASPKALDVISGLLARLLPRLPLKPALDAREEPGLGTKGHMPTFAAMQVFMDHPQRKTPVMMVNWLKFRSQALYEDASAPVSGREAYLRYGRVAVPAAHYLGGKLLYAARFQQILIGNDGDPGETLWDEFALMQYPGRDAFKKMASMRRYRQALRHRNAGLVDCGQGLSVTRPDADFVWRP